MEFPLFYSEYIPGIVAALNVAMEDADRTLYKDLMRNYMMDEGSSEGKVILGSGSLWMYNIFIRTSFGQ